MKCDLLFIDIYETKSEYWIAIWGIEKFRWHCTNNVQFGSCVYVWDTNATQNLLCQILVHEDQKYLPNMNQINQSMHKWAEIHIAGRNCLYSIYPDKIQWTINIIVTLFSKTNNFLYSHNNFPVYTCTATVDATTVMTLTKTLYIR